MHVLYCKTVRNFAASKTRTCVVKGKFCKKYGPTVDGNGKLIFQTFLRD